MKAQLGREFGIALCDHFNVPAGQVEVLKVHTGFDEVFSASLTIMLTADDLAAIAARMDGKVPESEQEPVSAHFDPPATDADLARFSGKSRITIHNNFSSVSNADYAATLERAARIARAAAHRNP